MSKYQRMESGAVPGSLDRETGPITIYSIGYSGISRGLNRTERLDAMAKLDEEMDDMISAVQKQMSVKYLAFLREQLVGFNLKRHPVIICSGMGSTSLRVGDKWVSDLRASGAVVDRLQELDQLLEGTCAWSDYLHNEVLT